MLSFALDVADRVLVIENGEIVRDDARAGVDEAQVAKISVGLSHDLHL